MIYTPMTKKAIRLMYEKHKEQFDKSGIPYVFHPFHVAEQMQDETTTTVALLHDIVEDTDLTLDDLRQMDFPNEVVEAIATMTHDSNISYEEYIRNIATNMTCVEVKLADLRHNMDLSRLNNVTEEDIRRLEKYKRSYIYLTEVLKSHQNNIEEVKHER